eukprot:208668_1
MNYFLHFFLIHPVTILSFIIAFLVSQTHTTTNYTITNIITNFISKLPTGPRTFIALNALIHFIIYIFILVTQNTHTQMSDFKVDPSQNSLPSPLSQPPLSIPIHPSLEHWDYNDKKQFEKNGNYVQKPNLFSFSTIGRTIINDGCGNWSPYISEIRRRIHSKAKLEHFYEAKATITFAARYLTQSNALGLEKFIIETLGESIAKIIIPTISWVTTNNVKNRQNMTEVKSLNVFFKAPYPNASDLIVEYLDNFDQHVLKNRLSSDKIINYYWNAFQIKKLPFAWRITTPKISAWIAPNIQDPKTVIQLVQIAYANVKNSRPSNMSVMLKINPRTGQLDLGHIFIYTNYQPFEMNGQDSIKISGWKIYKHQWNNMDFIVTAIGGQKKRVNRKQLIKNDGITSGWNKLVMNQEHIKLIVNKLYIEALANYTVSQKKTHTLCTMVSKIQCIFERDFITDCTAEQIIKYGIHHEKWKLINIPSVGWEAQIIEIIIQQPSINPNRMVVDGSIDINGNTISNSAAFPYTYKAIQELDITKDIYPNNGAQNRGRHGL